MSQQKPHQLTPEAYLELEATRAYRSEYVAGEIFAMTGGTVRHNRITMNLVRAVSRALGDRPCEVLGMDIKVRVQKANAYYYPDLLVRCGPLPGGTLVVEDPVLVVEVTSPSTEVVDRREKVWAYRQLPTLQEYALVSHDTQLVEVWRRTGDIGWSYHSFEPGSELDLPSVGLRLPLGEVYAGTDVPEVAPVAGSVEG